MTPEQQAALDATAAERASSLGLPHVVDGPQPYHANALTPAYHVPGNVEKPTEPSAADLDAVAAEESAKEQTNGNA